MENNVKERITAIDNEMKALEEKMNTLRNERWKLAQENSGFFIVNEYCGDGDQWDEHLYPLGITTEEKAKEIAKELNGLEDDDDYWLGCLPPYFEVSSEQYGLFKNWEHLKDAEQALKWCSGHVIEDIRMDVIDQIRAILSEIDNEKITRHGDDGTRGFIHIHGMGETVNNMAHVYDAISKVFASRV